MVDSQQLPDVSLSDRREMLSGQVQVSLRELTSHSSQFVMVS